MATGESQRTTQNSPRAAARFVRRSAFAIRAGSTGLSQYRAECLALIQWAQERELILDSQYIEQFKFIGDGAEHRVYRDLSHDDLEIKATHPNKYGYSTLDENLTASPCEYLRRPAYQNGIFGDDIRLVGLAYSEGHMEIVTSQPWISVHASEPNPNQDAIDKYMGDFGFQSISFDLDTPLYYSSGLDLVVADAHDRNVLRDNNGNLVAIDLVIGRPSPRMRVLIEEFSKDPRLPF